MNWSNVESEEFVSNAVSYWAEIEAGKSAGANRLEKANARLVQKLRDRGILESSLQPLLSHPLPAVRFAAAAYLAKSPVSADAADALRALLDEPTLVAVSAAAVMRVHGLK